MEPKTLDQAHRERDAAMDAAERGTSAEWAGHAIDAIDYLLNTQDRWSGDDIWDRLEDQGVAAPREPRALGPILKGMAGTGKIEADGFTESRRRHGAPIRVYRAGDRY